MTQQQILLITENLIAQYLALMQIKRQRINTTISSKNRYSVQNCYHFRACRIFVKVLSVIAATKLARCQENQTDTERLQQNSALFCNTSASHLSTSGHAMLVGFFRSSANEIFLQPPKLYLHYTFVV
ncbi:Hypothetical_protein [Hexamita inflata]|uniref:Hypothetical_protein n=1 Tax=Hexamita inflata TaxID=28002 RepID=A0AA86UM75_9EUKA|nr:Hypothetical protein HINF_LOCUS7453 [Hexamita inflata]CAI9956816.1 Hypothetical protein HINF_LOCUS44461 [Hexamita inflata]CAI9956818.1 Hypothetical protein HINF_LOCUS44463 [Hexamita inflata]